VLDRIRVAPADVAVRRVVMYVVPYLTPPPAPRTEPTARSVWSATGSLPRDLPRVNGIERLQRERREASAGLAALRRIRETSPDRLRAAARALFATYRRTRRAAALQELAGRAGLSASDADPAALDETLPWVPESLGWRSRDREWRWGVAVAERIVLGALAALRARLAEGRPGERDALVRARADVSMRAWRIRWLRTELREELRRAGGSADAHADVVALARGAYERLRLPGRLQEELRALEDTLGECRRRLGAVTDLPRVGDLLAAEVVENAFAVRVSQVPVPFDFVHASAGVPSALGHERDTPESKLCGMELHHFAGFLKRSWRASDWLWGRLDGTHHLVRALVDAESLGRGDVPGLADRIAAFAFPEGDEGRALADAWRRTCGGAAGADPRRDLADRLARVQAGGDTGSALDACCLAIAARVQLAVLREDLVEVARAITVDLGAGAAGGTAGERWAELVAAAGPEPDGLALVGLFRRLDLAQAESVDEELGADLVRGTVQQAAGTAARLLLGAHGGVPVRLPGTVKGAVELMVERLAPGLLDEAD
jgi:hypothetical protein